MSCSDEPRIDCDELDTLKGQTDTFVLEAVKGVLTLTVGRVVLRIVWRKERSELGVLIAVEVEGALSTPTLASTDHLKLCCRVQIRELYTYSVRTRVYFVYRNECLVFRHVCTQSTDKSTDRSALSVQHMCTLCEDRSALSIQKGVHSVHRQECTQCADKSALIVQKGVLSVYRHECTLCEDRSTLGAQTGVHSVHIQECTHRTERRVLNIQTGVHPV